jgi:peptidylprolyl isomerase
LSPVAARRVRVLAGVAAAAAAISLATRPRDPPLIDEPPPDGRFVPLPRPPPRRALPDAPEVVEWSDAAHPLAGVEWIDAHEGAGAVLYAGDVAVLEATFWRGDGPLFESTFESGAPVRWVVGDGALVPGLDAALPGMAVGGRRVVWLEPDAGFGGAGIPGRIPPGVGLQVEVELVDVLAPPGRAPAPGSTDRQGEGPAFRPELPAVVDYSLWSTADPGSPVDSSLFRWYPHLVAPGAPRSVLFERALAGLRVGGRRTIRAPATEVFGPAGRPPLAPPDAELVLELRLLSVGPDDAGAPPGPNGVW